MGGLIEIAGTELSAIDALLYVWFVLAALSTAYVVWDNFVNKNPEETVMKWGVDAYYPLHGARRPRPLRYGS